MVFLTRTHSNGHSRFCVMLLSSTCHTVRLVCVPPSTSLCAFPSRSRRTHQRFQRSFLLSSPFATYLTHAPVNRFDPSAFQRWRKVPCHAPGFHSLARLPRQSLLHDVPLAKPPSHLRSRITHQRFQLSFLLYSTVALHVSPSSVITHPHSNGHSRPVSCFWVPQLGKSSHQVFTIFHLPNQSRTGSQHWRTTW